MDKVKFLETFEYYQKLERVSVEQWLDLIGKADPVKSDVATETFLMRLEREYAGVKTWNVVFHANPDSFSVTDVASFVASAATLSALAKFLAIKAELASEA